MKKITTLLVMAMLMFSTLAYAGGDKNCGDKGQGTTGSTGQGETSQTRTPNP